MNIIKINSTSSTNTFLKELSSKQQLSEGTVIQTYAQTAGRGQHGTSWEAEPGKNITCSILLYPDFLPLSENFLLSKVIALGIKDTLSGYVENVTIKWPNDIYIRNEKISGTLIENELTGQKISLTIAGIGVNINQNRFVSDAPNPISLKQILKKETDLDILLEKMISKILFWYGLLKQNQYELISKRYFDSLYRNKGIHYFQDSQEKFAAEIQKVENNGLLHLKTTQGEFRKYLFKEVAFII